MSWAAPDITDRPVAILGGGVLGQRIACTWCASGYNVNLYDIVESQRIKAAQYVKDNASTYPTCSKDIKPGTFRGFEDMKKAVEHAWLVIEAVPEKLELKTEVFEQLEHLAPSDAILGTNSSSYKSREVLGKVKSAQSRILNIHFTMPPNNRLVELMTDGSTQEDIFPFLEEKLKDIGLHPVRAYKESTGFVVNRVWAALKRECLQILAEGVSTPEQLDAACVELFGMHNVGPCRFMDQIGLDTVAFIEEHYVKERNLTREPLDFLEKYISQKKLGNKTGEGLYPPKEHQEDPSLFFLDIGMASAPTEVMTAGKVIAGSVDGDVWKVIADHETAPDGISISKKNKRLYWTQMGIPGKPDGCIKSANLDGGDIKVILPKGTVNTLKQLIVRDDEEKLYFCDREGMKVRRCNFDGSELETLIDAGDSSDPAQKADQSRWCVGINVANGKIYWTQKGASKSTHGRIFRANAEMPAGATAKTRTDIEVVLQDLPEPIDIEVDEIGGYLYWTDRGELPFGNSINRVAFKDMHPGKTAEGQRGKGYQIVARNLHEAIGLALDTKHRWIYCTDLGGSVYRFNMDADSVHQGEMQEIYRKQGAGAFTGIALLN